MKTETRVKISPTTLDEEWFDIFQDQVLSIYLGKIKELISPLEGKTLDPKESHLEPMHFAAFTEQYSLQELKALKAEIGNEEYSSKTAIPAQTIDELIDSIKDWPKTGQDGKAKEPLAATFNCYPIRDKGFSRVVLESINAGVLGNFVHSLFLPQSKFKRPLMPEKANPFFMLASGIEARMYIGNLGDPEKQLTEPETVWNLILSTPAGSKALMITRQGLSSSLDVKLLRNTMESEQGDIPGQEEIKSTFSKFDVMFDPKKTYKKFSDGETPLHPLFYTFFNEKGLSRPHGPIKVLFSSDNDWAAYNASLSCLEILSEELLSLDRESAGQRVSDLIKLGQSLRREPDADPTAWQFIDEVARDELDFFTTPEVVLEMIMTEAFTVLPDEVFERLEQRKLTNNERQRFVKSSLASDMVFGLLLENKVIHKN